MGWRMVGVVETRGSCRISRLLYVESLGSLVPMGLEDGFYFWGAFYKSTGLPRSSGQGEALQFLFSSSIFQNIDINYINKGIYDVINGP